jgi:hypothetical protein
MLGIGISPLGWLSTHTTDALHLVLLMKDILRSLRD